ncbi:MAG: hypothetical protein ACRD2L_25730, partial [Terriglobia bacterium]
GVNKAWTDEAREASIEARRTGAKGKDIAGSMYLQYGSKKIKVSSPEMAGEIWDGIRDKAMAEGAGPDDMEHQPMIVDEGGKVHGHVSWNGRVWRGDNPGANDRTEWKSEK